MRRTEMRTMGFVISHKENEYRRALLPNQVKSIRNRESLFFEQGYGEVLTIQDSEYAELGCKMVTREVALQQDIICEPKIGDAEFLEDLQEGQMIFGWVHALQSKEVTTILANNHLTAYAWEDMYEDSRHSYWRNNELAGEAAVMHAFQLHGIMPYDTKVALLGRGNTARGAQKILTRLGADVMVYSRSQEQLFQKELPDYDVIVNAILWDTSREDHIISKSDLKKLKNGAMIIDISCDTDGAIETSRPTTFENPVYEIDGVLHYAVDHTPSIFYKTSSLAISRETVKYIDDLIENNPNEVLENALIIENGKILDTRIIDFQDDNLISL